MQLAAEVLHELRQPLLGVKAYAQMLGEQDGNRASIALLLAQIDRMEQIISDFTRLSSDKPAPKEMIDLAAQVAEAKKLFDLNADSARVSLEIDAQSGVEVHGSPRLVQQLVLNLLNNARDAMSGRGKAKVVVARDQGGPTLLVADWGPGISPELRDKIFEPYVTSKARGSGLGLAVCRRIASEHGAQIALAPPTVLPDMPPPATVFKVTFPSGAAPAVTRKQLLIVDDEAIIRAVFRDLMGKECEIVEAETAEDALAELRRRKFDLIVSDKNLPGLSGLDLAQEARRLDPLSRVILMTGYPSLVTAQQALDLGVIDYLLKPFDEIREVREKLRAALATTPPSRFHATNKRIDIYEDNPASAKQICEALELIGMEPKLVDTGSAFGDEPPAGVVISWDFTPARGRRAVELGRKISRGAPFVVLAEHLTMEATLESLRGGATACLPKLLSDVRALSRELSRALKLTP